MADYTEEDASRAREIIDSLLDRDKRRDRFERGFRREEKFEDGFSIVDVEAHADEFGMDWELLSSIDAKFPAMEVAGGLPVPISLSLLIPWIRPVGGALSPLSSRHRFWDYYREELYYLFRARGRFFEDFPTIPLEDARKSFADRGQDFLAVRLATLRRRVEKPRGTRRGAPPPPPGPPPNILNLRQYAGGPPTSVSGCTFSVNTNSAGLSAYWSGAYYIAPNYFGAPTSPAVGVLQAGTYVFGINGGAYGTAVQWDTNAVCTLPGTPSVHLQY